MDGIQRLSEMIKGQKDKSLIKIVSYLMLQKDMEQDFLKEEKERQSWSASVRRMEISAPKRFWERILPTRRRYRVISQTAAERFQKSARSWKKKNPNTELYRTI